jgi:hypothetical protein
VSTDTEDAESSAVSTAEGESRKPGTFTSESARKAALARHAKRRAQQNEPQVDEDDARTVVVPVRIGGIIRALEKSALSGNSNAARELRSWLSEYPPSDGSVSVEQLDRQTRDRILARLLAELEQEHAAQSTDP